jgi:phytoene dehydrogenase-like protein
MATPRALVVGTGPNGLAAAVALARAGCRVTAYEASDQIGGGTRSAALTLPGFTHDLCSAVHPLGIASPFFRTLPLERHGLTWVHPEAPLAHPFDDGTAALLERSTRATGETLDRADARAWGRLLDPLVERWEAVFDDALRPIFHIPRHPLRLARLGFYGMRGAERLTRTAFEGARARALFGGIAGHSLLPLTRPPTAAIGLMLAIAGHAKGWPVAQGGSQNIANALASLLREHGGKIVTGTRIRSLDELIPASELTPADAILLDLTARPALEVAGPRLPERYRRQLARYRYGPGVFKIDWALSEPIPWRAPECARAATIHLGGTFAEIAASAKAAWESEIDERPFVLLAQPTLFDPTRAPPGQHTAWAYCHVPNGSPVDRTKAIELQVERFAPGFRDIILARSTRTAVELERHNPNLIGGEINGGAETVYQFVFRPALRLNPYTTPAQGLYLCSSSTPPGGGVHGMCGYNAAVAVLEKIESRR